MAVTKNDILNDIQLLKKGLQEVEFYIRNYTEDNKTTEKGVNGVIDYIGKILKEIIVKQAINYGAILEDAKKKGYEREFKTAYSILRQLNFIDYDTNNKLIIIGNRTKYLIKLSTNSKRSLETDTKKVNEIYSWVLDQLIKNEWIEINTIKGTFKDYEKEIIEAINKVLSENKGKLVDNKIYRVETEKSKGLEINKSRRIKELKDQIDTLERRIEIGQAMELSKEELQKLLEEKKKLEEELKQLENQQ